MDVKNIVLVLLLFPWTLVAALAVALYKLMKHDRKRDFLQIRILARALKEEKTDDRRQRDR